MQGELTCVWSHEGPNGALYISPDVERVSDAS